MHDDFFAYRQGPDIPDLLEGNVKIVLDTNVILNLHRYPRASADDIITIIRALGDKIWIPHHVAFEYYRNVSTVFNDQLENFGQTIASVQELHSHIESKLKEHTSRRRPSLIDLTETLNTLTETVSTANARLIEERNKFRDSFWRDTLHNIILETFSGKVGDPLSPEDLAQLESSGEKRYEKSLPPGFKDSSKTGRATLNGTTYQMKFGDLTIWEQVLRKCSEDHTDTLVFVTDDAKEDWCRKVGPKESYILLGARPELIEELRDRSGTTTMHMIDTVQFAESFARRLDIKLGKTTVEDVAKERQRLKTVQIVSCPTCSSLVGVEIGDDRGSSAFGVCDQCNSRFHVHRDGQGSLFTNMSVASTRRVSVCCPNCDFLVGINFNRDRSIEQRYCMNCCELLTVNAVGDILGHVPSLAREVSSGSADGLDCSVCGTSNRIIWSQGNLRRAVCWNCGELLELRAAVDCPF